MNKKEVIKLIKESKQKLFYITFVTDSMQSETIKKEELVNIVKEYKIKKIERFDRQGQFKIEDTLILNKKENINYIMIKLGGKNV